MAAMTALTPAQVPLLQAKLPSRGKGVSHQQSELVNKFAEE